MSLSKPKSDSNQLTIIIARNQIFEYQDCYYRCDADIEIPIQNDWIIVAMQGENYIASWNHDLDHDVISMEKAALVIQTDYRHNLSVMNLTKLEAGYDSNITMCGGHHIACRNFALNANYKLHFWRMTAADISNLVTASSQNAVFATKDKLEPNIKLKQKYQLLTSVEQLMQQYILCIPAGSEVKFGKRRYILSQNVQLYLSTNSIIDSYNRNRQYDIGKQKKLCANPFLTGHILTPNQIMLHERNDPDICFGVSTSAFTKQIQKCTFVSDNLYTSGTDKKRIRKMSKCNWYLRRAEAVYNRLHIMQKLQQIVSEMQISDAINDYLYLELKYMTPIKTNTDCYRNFIKGAYKLVMSVGNLDAVRDLITKDIDAQHYNLAIEIAIQSGNLEIVRYLAELDIAGADRDAQLRTAITADQLAILKYLLDCRGFCFGADFAPYLQLAQDKNLTQMLEYLESRPENLELQRLQVVAEAKKFQASFHKYCQLLAKKN